MDYREPLVLGDEVKALFTFESLQKLVRDAGFCATRAETFSVAFWIWEFWPNRFPILERFTPLFAWAERFLQRRVKSFSAHCYLVAQAEA